MTYVNTVHKLIVTNLQKLGFKEIQVVDIMSTPISIHDIVILSSDVEVMYNELITHTDLRHIPDWVHDGILFPLSDLGTINYSEKNSVDKLSYCLALYLDDSATPQLSELSNQLILDAANSKYEVFKERFLRNIKVVNSELKECDFNDASYVFDYNSDSSDLSIFDVVSKTEIEFVSQNNEWLEVYMVVNVSNGMVVWDYVRLDTDTFEHGNLIIHKDLTITLKDTK